MESIESSKKRKLVVIVLAALGIAIVALIARGLYPADLPARPAPFIDTIFANPLVSWAARLLLISGAVVIAFGGVFISLSIAIRIKNENGSIAPALSRSRTRATTRSPYCGTNCLGNARRGRICEHGLRGRAAWQNKIRATGRCKLIV